MRISDWSSDVCSSDLQKVSQVIRHHAGNPDDADVAIFGHRKDPTSFYLDDFPNYVLEEVSAVEGKSSTQLRNELFQFADSDYADKWHNTADHYSNVGVLSHLRTTSRSDNVHI